MGIVSRGQKKNKNLVYFMFGGLKNRNCFHEEGRCPMIGVTVDEEV